MAQPFSHDSFEDRDRLPIIASMQSTALDRQAGTALVPAHPDMGPASENFVDVREYLRIILKNQKMILIIIALFFGAAVIYSVFATRIYTSTSTVQVEPKSMAIMSKDDLMQNDTANYVQTQFQLLASRRLAERVVTKLKLIEDDDFMGRRGVTGIGSLLSFLRPASKPAVATEIDGAASLVLASIKIMPFLQTTIARIEVSDRSPKRARDIANTMAEEFVAMNLDRRVEGTSYARRFLEDQLSEVKLRLESAERELIAYSQKEQLINLDKTSLIEAQLAAANTELSQATGDRIKQEQAWRTAESTPGAGLAEVTANQMVQSLRQKRAELASDYQDKLGSFKPEFPSMIQLRGRIAELDRQIAREIANIKEALKNSYQTALQRELAIQRNVDTLKADLLDQQKRAVEYTILKRETDTTRSLYNDLLNRYKEVGVVSNIGANNVSLVDRGLLPGAPTWPKTWLNLLIGLALGLVAGVAAAVLHERIDDRIMSPDEVERATRLVSVGLIPKTSNNMAIAEALRDPHSGVSEAYRSLATSLQFSTATGLPKTLLVTSAGPGEGKSTTSLSTARHYANIGLNVLVIDCDLRRPSMHKLLGLSNDVGVSSYLAGRCDAPEAMQITDLPNLVFMSSGPLPPNPAELLSGPKFQTLLSAAAKRFDLVIVDSAPVMGLADATIIANKTEATLLVVAAGQTSRMAVRKALSRLRFSRGAVIGTVLTKFEARSAGYGYGYGYGYGHGYGYGDYSYGESKDPQSLPKAG